MQIVKRIILRHIFLLRLFSVLVLLPATGAIFDYPTQGTASYYTSKSCKKEGTSGVWTAYGERYDERALTCATRDRALFGRYIKVTNLENGKSVIVRVNDFGPNKKLFRKGRIIDLSKGAFVEIADTKKGVIKVKIEIQPNESKKLSFLLFPGDIT